MSDSQVASTESLLQDELPRSARCGGKAFVTLALVVGLGFLAFLSNGWTMNEPTMDMAWQPTQAKPLQSMQPVKSLTFRQTPKALPFMQLPRASVLPGSLSRSEGFATNALRNPSSALAVSGVTLSQQRLPDVRKTLALVRGLSPAQKCVYVDKHASLCGNLVVLRPSTAIHAEGENQKQAQALDADNLIKSLTDEWEAVEDKTSTALLAGGAVVGLIFANNILATVNAIPLLPSLLETVGLGFSGWFAYRYLLVKESREELASDIDELKQKITGSK